MFNCKEETKEIEPSESNISESSSSNREELSCPKRVKKPYTCEQCGSQCSTSTALFVHIRTHTGEKPYSCEICGSSFAHSGSLSRHIRTHTGEKPYSCEICSSSFSNSGDLSNHKRIHTGEKPFTCEICGFSFSASRSLFTHKRIHTGEKPYSCKICGASFSTSGGLSSHTPTHTGEKSFFCEVCGLSFARSGNLSRHKRTHTREKPYSCEICISSFSFKGSLTKHKRIHMTDDLSDCELDPETKALFSAKGNKIGPRSQPWTIAQKKILLYCYHYSKFEKWSTTQKIVLSEKIRNSDLPEEKKQTSVGKLRSLISQRKKYISDEEESEIRKKALKDAENDYLPIQEEETEKRLMFKWSKEEKWTLIWAMEYAQSKYVKQKQRKETWREIFFHFYPWKRKIPTSNITSQRYNIIKDRGFKEEELEYMKNEVRALIDSKENPLEKPIAYPTKVNKTANVSL